VRPRVALAALCALPLLGLVTPQGAAAGSAGPISGFGVDAAGRAVVALRAARSSKPLIGRFTAAGVLDPSFAKGGVLRPAVAGVGARIALRRDGGLVVGGNEGKPLVLRRYRPDGSPDRSFGRTGRVPVEYRKLQELLLQPGGGIVVLATSTCSPDRCGYLYNNLGVERYAQSGRRIHSYLLSKEAWQFQAAALEPDGGFVVAGNDWELEYQSYDRFLPSGAYEGKLHGRLGLTIEPEGEVVPPAGALAVQADHDLVVAVGLGTEIWRRKPSGAPDLAFGSGGRVVCGPTREYGMSWEPAYESLLVAADGRLVAAGAKGECGLVRYLPDGSPDSSFGGGDGRVDVEADGMPRPLAMALLADGGMILAGWDPAARAVKLARYTASGSLDLGFGAGGIAALAAPPAG
jgi:uncharacterized delta-60 repeat protein